jgi:protein tyrosine phosphatase (PTP) superfamily phosphohydrolase (DUF442 family)
MIGFGLSSAMRMTTRPDIQLPPHRSIVARMALWIVALLCLGFLAWYVTDRIPRWKDLVVPRKLRVVDPGQIYASGQINRRLLRKVLIDRHIKVIVCLVDDQLDDPDVAAERQLSTELGIERFNYPLEGDGTGDIHNYASAVAEMVEAERAGKPILVHCSSGAQRSNGAVFYYRVLVQHRDPADAAREMIHNAHDPRRNPALIPYLNAHMAEMAKLLADQKIVPAVPDPLPQIPGGI